MTQPHLDTSLHTAHSLVQRLATDDRTPEQPIFIPSLQREFCWSHTQIEELFDSLLRNLPLGSLLLWKVNGSEDRDEALYQFIKNYVGESAYPTKEKYDKDEVWVRNKSQKFDDKQTPVPERYMLALDGQQRLTALLIGLRGTHYNHQRQKWKSKLESYTCRRLHLDLLAPPGHSDNEDGLSYSFKFRDKGQNRTATGSYWWPIDQIMAAENTNQLVESLRKDLARNTAEADAIDANLTALTLAVFNRKHMVIESVSNMNSKEAVDLFVRRNRGGKKLSNADIAFSQIAVYWNLEDGDPKQAIESYVDVLESNFSEFGFRFSKGRIIRALLTLDGKGPTLRRDDLVPSSIKPLERIWLAVLDRDDLGEAYRIVGEELGLGRRCIPSYKVLLPILYFCHIHRNAYSDSATITSSDLLDQMEYWIASVTCNQLLGDLNDDLLLRDFCSSITEDRFPVIEVLDRYRSPTTHTRLTRDQLERIIQATSYGSGARMHYLLTRLYGKDRISGTLVGESGGQWQVDHIFPVNAFANDAALETRGVTDPDTIAKCREYRDRIANLQLIAENQSKKDKDPGQWLAAEESAARDLATLIEDHHLPRWDISQFDEYARFPDFCAERQRLITEHLSEKLPLYEDLREIDI